MVLALRAADCFKKQRDPKLLQGSHAMRRSRETLYAYIIAARLVVRSMAQSGVSHVLPLYMPRFQFGTGIGHKHRAGFWSIPGSWKGFNCTSFATRAGGIHGGLSSRNDCQRATPDIRCHKRCGVPPASSWYEILGRSMCLQRTRVPVVPSLATGRGLSETLTTLMCVRDQSAKKFKPGIGIYSSQNPQVSPWVPKISALACPHLEVVCNGVIMGLLGVRSPNWGPILEDQRIYFGKSNNFLSQIPGLASPKPPFLWVLAEPSQNDGTRRCTLELSLGLTLGSDLVETPPNQRHLSLRSAPGIYGAAIAFEPAAASERLGRISLLGGVYFRKLWECLGVAMR